MCIHRYDRGRGRRAGGGGRPSARAGVLGGAALLLALTACDPDRILDVRDPEFATPESLEDPNALPILVAGAMSDFQVAYSGMFGLHSPGVVTASAALTDEFFHSGTFTTRQRTDQRRQFHPSDGNYTDITFTLLQRARRSAKDASSAVETVEGPDDGRIPLLQSLEGYSYVALAENFCSAVPISSFEDGEWIDGPPLGTSELLEEAVARFDRALALEPGNHVAALGKGRALLSLGRYDEAAAAVSGVPTEFVYFVEHSDNTSRQENQVFNLQSNGRWSMGDRHGENGLAFRSAGDPRTPWFQDPAGGFDDRWELFVNLRYPTRGSGTPLADGIQARLIEAEAALNAGDVDGWLGHLNDLRANVADLMAARFQGYSSNVPDASLPPLQDPGTMHERVDLLFEERGFWLYLTGHRLGDLRRLVRDYGRPQDQVFPAGTHHTGETFGTDVALQIPFDEENNPHYNVAMCDVSQP